VQDLDTVKRTLKIVAASFAAGAVAIFVVVSSVDLGEPDSPDLADGGALAAAVFGVAGLLIALQWWSSAREQAQSPAKLQMGFVIRTAIAELGLLLGVLALVMSGSTTPMAIGLGLFLITLLFLVLALDRAVDG
jgi:drug/metabolite transporter (DMT)-like permease